MSNMILKIILALLVVGNLGWLVYNASTYFGDLAQLQEESETALDAVESIELKRKRLQTDLDKIAEKGYVLVKDVNSALDKQMKAIGIRPLPDGVQIPLQPKDSSGGRAYAEQVWKISFTSRDKLFSARNLAKFCQNVEQDLPGYQIKSVDLGIRDAAWGQDLWKPQSIEVRRLRRKEKTR